MKTCFASLIAYSEARTRDEIARIPDGSYFHEEPLLDDGAQGGPFYLRLQVVKRGSEISFDFTGTDKQISGPINSPLAITLAAVYYVMRCLTGSTIPSTEGCKRPITVIAPAGTLVNARSPAAVYQRMIVCHTIVDLVMGALYTPLSAHTNASGATHGGALMTLLDVTIASAARSVQKDMGLVTIEMKTSFMQTAQGRVTCKGRLMHRSTSMAFAEATVFDAAGAPCAHATATFKYTRALVQGVQAPNAGPETAPTQ